MKKLTVLIILLSGILSFSCKNKKESAPPEEPTAINKEKKEANRIDGKWEINYMAGTEKPLDSLFPKTKPVLTIESESSEISGSTGCNNFSGELSIEGNNFKLNEEIAITKRMCPDMTGENKLMDGLKKVNSYSVTERGQTLNLISGDIAIMRFNRKR